MILGLCGQAGSGKSFIADILQERYSYKVISFADPLKRICQDVFKFTNQQLWGPSEFRNIPDKRWPRPCKSCHSNGYFIDDSKEQHSIVKCQICDGVGKTYLTPREALQQLGTEWGRSCYENIWVQYAIGLAQTLSSNPVGPWLPYSAQSGLGVLPTWTDKVSGVVISDVRFQNEIDGIMNAGGKVIRIKRDTSTLKCVAVQHSSEVEQASIPDSVFNYVLQNVQDLDALNLSIETMMFKLGA